VEGAFLPLRSLGDHLVDAAGREVLVRALQHHALQDVDYGGREVEPDDYARIASWGFTALRVAISWSRIEPQRGSYDRAYLAEILDVLDRAAAVGLSVILEWHQDLWGRCSQDPASSLSVSANGAPDWTCPAGLDRSATLVHWTLFDRLWSDTDNLQLAMADAWGVVIAAVRGHPALLGYDLINEPQGTGGSPALERDKIFPFYRFLVPAVRARGAEGLLLLDAPILRNETFEMYAEPLDDLGPDVVFAPHLYSGWLRLFLLRLRVTPDAKERDFAAAAAQAATLRMPLFNGEWGVNLLLDGAVDDLRTHVGLEERYRIGSSWWAFQRAVPGQGDDSISGGQSLLDEQRRVRGEVLDALSRPYPIQTPGRLQDLSFDFGSHTLEAIVDVDPSVTAPLVLFAPARHLGPVGCLDVAGPGGYAYDLRRDRERVLVRFDVPGRYRIVLAPCGP
jgi:hypothetical protein